jgi:hypothetical protein
VAFADLTAAVELGSPLNANVVAEGDAELSPLPGYVITIFPPIGIELTVVNVTVCIAVIGTCNISDPAPAEDPILEPR